MRMKMVQYNIIDSVCARESSLYNNNAFYAQDPEPGPVLSCVTNRWPLTGQILGKVRPLESKICNPLFSQQGGDTRRYGGRSL